MRTSKILLAFVVLFWPAFSKINCVEPGRGEPHPVWEDCIQAEGHAMSIFFFPLFVQVFLTIPSFPTLLLSGPVIALVLNYASWLNDLSTKFCPSGWETIDYDNDPDYRPEVGVSWINSFTIKTALPREQNTRNWTTLWLWICKICKRFTLISEICWIAVELMVNMGHGHFRPRNFRYGSSEAQLRKN